MRRRIGILSSVAVTVVLVWWGFGSSPRPAAADFCNDRGGYVCYQETFYWDPFPHCREEGSDCVECCYPVAVHEGEEEGGDGGG